jgi:hypothetical protein
MVKSGLLIGVTCADLGHDAIKELPASLDKNPSVGQLKAFGGLMGIRHFALGFPNEILALNLATRQYEFLSESNFPGYTREYANLCNVSSLQPASIPRESVTAPVPAPNTQSPSIASPVPIPSTAAVYVGTFQVTVTQSDGTPRTIRVIDGLGVYTPAGFERAKAAELAAREQVMREKYAQSGLTVTNVDLVDIKTTGIPQ